MKDEDAIVLALRQAEESGKSFDYHYARTSSTRFATYCLMRYVLIPFAVVAFIVVLSVIWLV